MNLADLLPVNESVRSIEGKKWRLFKLNLTNKKSEGKLALLSSHTYAVMLTSTIENFSFVSKYKFQELDMYVV